MRKKELYRSVVQEYQEAEVLQCELCNNTLNKHELIEISSDQDSTILCSSCAGKFNNLSSFYDE